MSTDEKTQKMVAVPILPYMRFLKNYFLKLGPEPGEDREIKVLRSERGRDAQMSPIRDKSPQATVEGLIRVYL